MSLFAELDVDTLRTWIEIVMILGGLMAILWRWERRLSKRLDQADETRTELTQLLADNFGPNHGGLRETVNFIRTDIVELKKANAEAVARMDKHIQFHLEGK